MPKALESTSGGIATGEDAAQRTQLFMMVTPGGELLSSDLPSGIDLTRGSTYPDLRRKLATRGVARSGSAE